MQDSLTGLGFPGAAVPTFLSLGHSLPLKFCKDLPSGPYLHQARVCRQMEAEASQEHGPGSHPQPMTSPAYLRLQAHSVSGCVLGK